MDHPNIAKVFDAGTTSTGRPYLVTELTEGIPITQYCDQTRLPTRQRLEMFVLVCEAVQHAHQKGILHGNLNPSNVLMTQSGDRPAPKVVDFGIPQATRQRPSEGTPGAGSEGLAGTLEYLSPEQAEWNPLDIDTRSDVYSLGVLLYELLTDTTPLERQLLKQATIPEALRLIREHVASPPSQRLSDSKESLPIVAAKRNTDPVTLVKAVQGEVDAVVMTALQKDRTGRYQTASELARDIERYLAAEPVEAYPSSPASRMWKWARKYPRGLLGAAAMLLLLLAVGVVGVVLTVNASRMKAQARRTARQATAERDQSQKEATDFQRRLEVAEAARQSASKDRDQELAAEMAAKASSVDAKAVLAFLKNSLLSASRPEGWQDGNWAGGRGKDMTLRQAVDAAEVKVARTFANQPLAEALIRETLGLSYLDLGEPKAAVKQYERALALREALQGYNSPATVACRNQLAVAFRNDNRPNDASRLYDAHHESPSHASALAINGSVLLSQNKPVEAELKLRKCLAIRQKLQPDHWTTFEAKSLLGEALLAQKKYAEAEPLLLSGYQDMKKRQDKIASADKPRLTQALERLVRFYEAWGKKDKATQWQKELDAAKAAEQSSSSRKPLRTEG